MALMQVYRRLSIRAACLILSACIVLPACGRTSTRDDDASKWTTYSIQTRYSSHTECKLEGPSESSLSWDRRRGLSIYDLQTDGTLDVIGDSRKLVIRISDDTWVRVPNDLNSPEYAFARGTTFGRMTPYLFTEFLNPVAGVEELVRQGIKSPYRPSSESQENISWTATRGGKVTRFRISMLSEADGTPVTIAGVATTGDPNMAIPKLSRQPRDFANEPARKYIFSSPFLDEHCGGQASGPDIVTRDSCVSKAVGSMTVSEWTKSNPGALALSGGPC